VTARHILAWCGAGAASAFAGHAAPVVTSHRRLRMTVCPSLAGVGRPGHVALTFDDGPDPMATPRFLAELDRIGWRATFFMLGSMVRRAPALAAEVAAAGHEVAVHGDEHRSQLARRPRAIADDMSRARDTIAAATGVEPRFSRPPYGMLSTAGMRASRRLGLSPVLWTAWGRDWRAAATPTSVFADVMGDVDSRGTVLLHDSDCTSAAGAWRSALGALVPLADAFAERRWSVGPLADHGIADHGIADHGIADHGGGSHAQPPKTE
jgi:peptidoglycan/xylan/chitin deacetylase (PgdA/CDA1 family)